MDQAPKSPNEVLPYHTVMQMTANRPSVVHSANPGDSALSALTSMAEKGIGFLVVLEGKKLVGVLSERDFGRKVVLAGRTVKDTPVGDIMTREVVTVTPEDRFGDCLLLMDRHGLRHLPVVEGDCVVGVLSVRDLMREAVAHHQHLLAELERERMTVLASFS